MLHFIKKTKIYVYSGGPVEFNRYDDITDLIIQDGVTVIPDQAFTCWEYLEYVKFPKTIIHIGEQAFLGCAFESLDLPDSLESIGDYAFHYCGSLESVNLPRSLQSIGENAFGNCLRLTEISFPHSIIDMKEYAFFACRRLQTIDITPTFTTTIKEHTFRYCSALNKVDISPTITSIGANSFDDCNSIRSIKLQYGLQTIRWQAFANCTSLQSVQIPPSTISIDGEAFLGCTSLRVVYVPSRAIHIARSAFAGCNSSDIIILTDLEELEYESIPTLTLQNIQQCIHDLPNNIPTSQQAETLHQVFYNRFPTVAIRAQASMSNVLHHLISNIFTMQYPTYLQQSQQSKLSLLHLLVYFPCDIYEPLSHLLRKCPQMTSAVDSTGKTPLHHAIASTKQNMDTRCYNLLRQHSPDNVVNLALKSESPLWHEILDIVKIKINGLRIEDKESGLMPFMLAAEKGIGLDVDAVYELLCLQPDVLNKFA